MKEKRRRRKSGHVRPQKYKTIWMKKTHRFKFFLWVFALASSPEVSAQWRDDFSTNLFDWKGDTSYFACTGQGLASRGRHEASDIGIRRAFYRDVLPDDSAFCIEFALDLGFVPSSTNTVRLYLAASEVVKASDTVLAEGEAAPVMAGRELYLHLGQKGGENYWQLWEQTPDTLWQIWQGNTLFSRQSQMRMRVRAVFDTGGVWRLFHASGLSNTARWEQDGAALSGGLQERVWPDKAAPVHVGMQCAYKTASRATMYGFPYVYTGLVPVSEPSEDGDALSVADSLAMLHPAFGNVIINEVMFNPATGESRYVEVFNRTDTAFGMLNWSLGFVQEGDWKYYRLTTDTQAVLEAGAYAAWAKEARKVALSSSACRENIFTAKSFPTLDTKTGLVRLLWLPPKGDGMQGDTLVIDEIRYSEEFHHWLLSDPKGVALERLRADVSGVLPENWMSAAETSGFATPGCVNSHAYPDAQESQKEYFVFTPPVVTPNNDGWNDFTVLTWDARLDGYVCSAAVYDERGRKVCRICDKKLLGAGGSLRYDAVDDGGRVLRPGVYAVLVELLRSDGKIKRLRYVLGVA